MYRAILFWALVMAGAAFGLQWLEFQTLVRQMPPQVYGTIIGVAFAAGGVWVGWRLAARPSPQVPALADAKGVGVTGQEMKVLEALAAGASNKEIARALGLSPNTVKTHLANLFAKLEVARRTQAIRRARELRLIP